MSNTFHMNKNHRNLCPCYSCLKVGDKVFVYLNQSGSFSEEIETEINEIQSGGSNLIGVEWPHLNDTWFIYPDTGRPKEKCYNAGKVIRKITA